VFVCVCVCVCAPVRMSVGECSRGEGEGWFLLVAAHKRQARLTNGVCSFGLGNGPKPPWLCQRHPAAQAVLCRFATGPTLLQTQSSGARASSGSGRPVPLRLESHTKPPDPRQLTFKLSGSSERPAYPGFMVMNTLQVCSRGRSTPSNTNRFLPAPLARWMVSTCANSGSCTVMVPACLCNHSSFNRCARGVGLAHPLKW